MNLTSNQILAIILAILGVLTASTSQLTDLVGATDTKIIQSLAGLLSGVLGSVLAILTSQGNQIKNVEAMPGVDKIVANQAANSSLATRAIDPTSKVEAAPGAEAAINQAARS